MNAPALETPAEPAASASPTTASASPAATPVPVQQAQQILSRPAMSAALGPRPAQQRRLVSWWRKAIFVVSPLVVTPVAFGTAAAVGAVLIGAGAGALMPKVGVNAGIAYASIGAFTLAPMATLAGTVVSLIQATSRLKMSRTELTNRLERRRMKKHAKAAGPTSRKGFVR